MGRWTDRQTDKQTVVALPWQIFGWPTCLTWTWSLVVEAGYCRSYAIDVSPSVCTADACP